ncbi:DUF6683 family protein [Piscinibacter sp.]|uniref:DUF6683 family protein n=1 Tax=Piscinibacter sp. TaxID=1903157 RepID=UPI002D7E26EC|nr:DUF6683 family protein [Albitalea sp.]
MRTLHLKLRFVAVGVLLVHAAGSADAGAPDAGYVEMPRVVAPKAMNTLVADDLQLLKNAYPDSRAAGTNEAAASTLAPATSRGTTAARDLAARYPAAQRAQIERAFVDSLAAYRQIETKLGIPGNDVAGAVAAFVAGSYMAYRDVDVPDERFKRLVDQLRGVLAANRAFAQASAAEKRDTYEQLAIVGTFMAVTRLALKQQPPDAAVAANFRQAAKANLEQFLKTDADRVAIDERGLVIR